MNSGYLLLMLEAAFRAALGAIVVWCGLRLFRVSNVLVQKATWTTVLVAALATPLLMRWPWMPRPLAVSVPVFTSGFVDAHPVDRDQAAPVQRPFPQPAHRADPHQAPSSHPRQYVSPSLQPISRVETSEPLADTKASPAATTLLPLGILCQTFYFGICAVLCFRLLWGLVAAIGLWREAKPLPEPSESIPLFCKGVRVSARMASPVNIGPGVILPADYITWDSEKLQMVLAHERSHVYQGDFFLQALTSLYVALFWFSPLGWWLKRRLSELSEAISDRAGLDEAASPSSYAQLLLEFAARPQPTLIGVAMARKSNLSHRIEWLLDEAHFRQAFAASRRSLVAAALAPIVMLATTTLVRVEATAQASQQAARTSSSTPTTSPAQPVTLEAAQTPSQAEPSPAPSAASAPTTPATPASPVVHVRVPPIHVIVPATHVDVPAVHVDLPAKHIDVPAQHIDIPAQHIDIPAQHIEVPAIRIDVPPASEQNKSDNHTSHSPAGEFYAMLSGFGRALIQRTNSAPPDPPLLANAGNLPGRLLMGQAAPGQELTFDRTLTVNGKLELTVATGAGNIHLSRGSSGQVRIHGIVRAGRDASGDEVRQIVANPPIEQNGNSIRVGARNNAGMRNISISYEIEAPADTALTASTGSGDIVDDGVGQNAKLTTGSGNINATGLQGGFSYMTGSGNIHSEESGEGEGKAQTGSGDLDLKSVHGSLKAQTGSGNIKVAGTPSAPWRLMAGSGSIELSVGNSPMTINAATGSGSIHTDQPLASQGTADRHHVAGNLNGGGTEVRLETGSGDITVH